MYSYIYTKEDDNFICYFIEYNTVYLDINDYNKLTAIIIKNDIYDYLDFDFIVVGPRLNHKTPWCSNILEIFKKCNINIVERIEKFRIYKINQEIIYDKMTEQIYNSLPETYKINIKKNKTKTIKDISLFNEKMDLAMDDSDIKFYTNLFLNKLKRYPTDIELFDLSQSNSEHSRHWIFNGKIFINGDEKEYTLFELVKMPHQSNKSNSVLAFCDNSSAIKGYFINLFKPSSSHFSKYTNNIVKSHFSFTAETHNFPTGVAPFQGATTGIGGRIRDNLAIGRGGTLIASTAGYCVGDIFTNENAIKIEIDASNGSSDYGNKIGEPIIQGFTRSFGQTIHNTRYEWIKPIMFTGGIGQVLDYNLLKEKPRQGLLITRIGGPAYRIGLGGGSSSSRENDEKNIETDLSAVQRGDPEMENKVYRVIRTMSERKNNPIISIHDQGAGGMGNVTKEIVSPVGGEVYLNNVNVGDKTMSALEIWGAEYQEQVTILIDPQDKDYVHNLCDRENVPVSFVGTVNDTGNINVYNNNQKIVSLNLDDVLENIPQKEYHFYDVYKKLKKLIIPSDKFVNHISKVFSLLSVGSKRFLTNKVDRSVTGLIAQQQCVGPLHTPLSDYAIVSQSINETTGSVISIGEQPIKSFISSSKMVRMTVGEMLTNLIFAKITRLEDIKCSGNWMWAPKLEGEGYELYNAVISLKKLLIKLGVAIDGGKDSLSMCSIKNNKIIKTPRTLVLSAYAPMDNITKKITPDFKYGGSDILFIDLGYNYTRLGGSALAQIYNQIGDDCPDFKNITLFKLIFDNIQNNLFNKILSGHDKSDGGLITTVLEMCFAGNKGCILNIDKYTDILKYFFNEEIGLVIEVYKKHTQIIIDSFNNKVPVYKIGETIEDNIVEIVYNGEEVLNEKMTTLRQMWEKTSYMMEKKQMNNELAKNEYDLYGDFFNMKYEIPEHIINKLCNNTVLPNIIYKVGILREEGSNGDREMANAFHSAGFDVWDINMNDLINNKNLLDDFHGIVFVGGFSFSDVICSAQGWYSVIKNNENVLNQINNFYQRENTFSLGVCNGCQLMALLDIIPNFKELVKNNSQRFESRFSTVQIPKNNSIMLNNMEGLKMGIWVAHGEGKINFSNNELVVMQYVDNHLNPTEQYPFNPNGSINGVAAVTSIDGRHLAMMPHPERSFLNWQLPWIPEDLKTKFKNNYSPWYLMFKNAYNWCSNHS